MTWQPIGWQEFCAWLKDRRVWKTSEEGGETVLEFVDGSQARLLSNYDPPTEGYSEYTPGEEGGVRPPTAEIWTEEEG